MATMRNTPATLASAEQVSVWRRLFRASSAGTIARVSRMSDSHAQGWPITEMLDDNQRFEANAWADTEWADTQPSDLGDL